jgi:hypothetical protein
MKNLWSNLKKVSGFWSKICGFVAKNDDWKIEKKILLRGWGVKNDCGGEKKSCC